MRMVEFFELYFKYVEDNTESAFVYHRWSLIGILATVIAKKVEIPMGHFTIYTNTYIQIIGRSGTRKSSAISVAVKLLKDLGFDRFAPKKCSKEAFLSRLVQYTVGVPDALPNLEGEKVDPFDMPPEVISNMLIAADEFNAFLGNNYDDFLEILSELFDMPDVYDKWLQKGSSDILNPFITILSGNTPSGFRLKFKGNSLNQGILTRFIIIPWHETRCKIAFPESPCPKMRDTLLKVMRETQARRGTVSYSNEAKVLLNKLYSDWEIPTPIHMEQYVERRYVHLLRLCAIFATVESDDLIVTSELVVLANTILASNESNMATAFRDIFDAPGQSIARSAILDRLKSNPVGLSMQECLKAVNHLGVNNSDVVQAIQTLVLHGDIMKTQTGAYIQVKKKSNPLMAKFLNYEFLTKEERDHYVKR